MSFRADRSRGNSSPDSEVGEHGEDATVRGLFVIEVELGEHVRDVLFDGAE
jgi:hypothetical protein